MLKHNIPPPHGHGFDSHFYDENEQLNSIGGLFDNPGYGVNSATPSQAKKLMLNNSYWVYLEEPAVLTELGESL